MVKKHYQYSNKLFHNIIMSRTMIPLYHVSYFYDYWKIKNAQN